MRRINLSTSLLAGIAAITMAAPASAQETHGDIDVVKLVGGDGTHLVRGTDVENHTVVHGAGEIDRYLNPDDPRFGRDRPEENAQAGMEHPAIVQIEEGPHAGKLVICALGSMNGIPTDIEGDGIYERDGLTDLEDPDYVVTTFDRTQLYMAVLAADPNGGWFVEKAQYISDTDGNRYRNAHKCRMELVNGGQDVLVQRNFAPNNDDNNNGGTCQANHACSYGRVVNGALEALSNPRADGRGDLLVYKNNDNCSENDGPSVIAEEECVGDTCTTTTVQGDGCNGNGTDDAWVSIIKTTCDNSITEGYKCSPVNYADVSISQDHERWRGQCHKDEDLSTEVGEPVVVCCGTAGNTQPPNKSVRCNAIVATDVSEMNEVNRNNNNRGYDGVYPNGLNLWDDSDYGYNGLYVAENYRDEDGDRVYNTEIKCDSAAAGSFMCRWQKGYPRGGNKRKGEYQGYFTMVNFRRDGLDVASAPQVADATRDITHGRLACLPWGTTGSEEMRCGHLTGSVVGSSGTMGGVQLMRWDTETNSVVEMAQYSIGAPVDLGWLNNLYGNNPNTQGRGYFEWTEVDNPNYGVEGAYHSGVKTYLAVVATGRTLRSEPEPGTDIRINEDKLGLTLSLIPSVIDAEDPDDEIGDDVNPDGDGSGDDGTGNGGGNNGGVAGCSVSSNGTSGGLLGLAFALFFVIRRRRRD